MVSPQARLPVGQSGLAEIMQQLPGREDGHLTVTARVINRAVKIEDNPEDAPRPWTP
jgi:hypothetical protein